MKYKTLCRCILLPALLLFGAQVALAQFTVSGRVTDANGEALPGATVAVVGASRGTTADVDGNYSVEIPGNAATLA
ncbi:MAG: carboxypeptidase-like regulatory domain-containing protein, partial [Saprospiraceae bacterium]|nr:carboxypeptidase-like regulatory domain-containing protein [Saprospiraceae bacterium]